MSGQAWPLGGADLARLGAMGFPLAFVALPLYVVLPHHYANTYQLPLAWIGALLLTARLATPSSTLGWAGAPTVGLPNLPAWCWPARALVHCCWCWAWLRCFSPTGGCPPPPRPWV